MQAESTGPAGDLIDRFLNAVSRADPHEIIYNFNIAVFPASRSVLDLPREQQVEAVLHAIPRQVSAINSGGSGGSLELGALLSAILRKKLPFTAAQLEQLVRALAPMDRAGFWGIVAPAPILKAVEDQVAAQSMTDGLRDALQQLQARLSSHAYAYAEPRNLLKRVEALLAVHAEAGVILRPRFELTTNEAWTRHLRTVLVGLEETTRGQWEALLTHCASAASSKPSGKWLRQAQASVDAIGPAAFAELATATLAEVGKPGALPPAPANALGFLPDPTQVHDTHADLLRGLVWCTSLVESAALPVAVGDAAEVCFKKLPGLGPRAPKIGNACLWALADRPSTAAVAQLSRVKTRAKHASTQAQLAKALDTAAEKTGLTPADLEELAVPTCGLTAVGASRTALGDFAAQVQITDGAVEVTWLRADGKTQATVPAAVKDGFAAELKALKQTEKEIAKLLPAQRDRLEQLFLKQRSWSLADFRSRFLDHPLVGTVARRLIWRFTDGSRSADATWADGRLVDETDRAVTWIGEATRVALWHPLFSGVEQVRAWREWLQAHAVRQPFKQAHREIYILTDAERRTALYSNRFAAHILKQHQFGALCHQRCWRYTLQGEWDSANTPTLSLPGWELRAEFQVEGVREGDPLENQAGLSAHMVYLHLGTDQVRFFPLESPVPMPLADVPPLVFSEVMRDVDLFVGVTSIAGDPTWADAGLTGRFREYWEISLASDLYPSAQTRKAVLERLVPALNIADRCSFSDRFLVVRGDLHTYKIHLGSGNVLMAPEDRYLCIIPKPGASPGKVYLPFEGDNLLSVILSKALLLAADTKIKDPTILTQMSPRAGLP